MPHVATRRALIRLAAACAALALLPAHAIYKWVDEKGVTHFSEHPPSDDRKASKVTPKVTPPSGTQGAPGYDPKSWKAQDAEFRKRQIDRGAREQAEAKEREKRAVACDRARSRLAFLQNSHRIFRDNPDGTRTYLEDSQRDAEVARARESAAEACR
jgi:hypothetical protein